MNKKTIFLSIGILAFACGLTWCVVIGGRYLKLKKTYDRLREPYLAYPEFVIEKKMTPEQRNEFLHALQNWPRLKGATYTTEEIKMLFDLLGSFGYEKSAAGYRKFLLYRMPPFSFSNMKENQKHGLIASAHHNILGVSNEDNVLYYCPEGFYNTFGTMFISCANTADGIVLLTPAHPDSYPKKKPKEFDFPPFPDLYERTKD